MVESTGTHLSLEFGKLQSSAVELQQVHRLGWVRLLVGGRGGLDVCRMLPLYWGQGLGVEWRTGKERPYSSCTSRRSWPRRDCRSFRSFPEKRSDRLQVGGGRRDSADEAGHGDEVGMSLATRGALHLEGVVEGCIFCVGGTEVGHAGEMLARRLDEGIHNEREEGSWLTRSARRREQGRAP